MVLKTGADVFDKGSKFLGPLACLIRSEVVMLADSDDGR